MSRVFMQLLGIFALAVALFVAWDFSQRVGTLARLRQSEEVLNRRVAAAEATHTALVAQKKRVQGNAAVEEFVRRNWHWARDGDTVVIPQITPAPTPTPAPLSSSSQQTSWWQGVLDFLFGP
jgi:cell division protein FtsB